MFCNVGSESDCLTLSPFQAHRTMHGHTLRTHNPLVPCSTRGRPTKLNKKANLLRGWLFLFASCFAYFEGGREGRGAHAMREG